MKLKTLVVAFAPTAVVSSALAAALSLCDRAAIVAPLAGGMIMCAFWSTFILTKN